MSKIMFIFSEVLYEICCVEHRAKCLPAHKNVFKTIKIKPFKRLLFLLSLKLVFSILFDTFIDVFIYIYIHTYII